MRSALDSMGGGVLCEAMEMETSVGDGVEGVGEGTRGDTGFDGRGRSSLLGNSSLLRGGGETGRCCIGVRAGRRRQAP